MTENAAQKFESEKRRMRCNSRRILDYDYDYDEDGEWRRTNGVRDSNRVGQGATGAQHMLSPISLISDNFIEPFAHCHTSAPLATAHPHLSHI